MRCRSYMYGVIVLGTDMFCTFFLLLWVVIIVFTANTSMSAKIERNASNMISYVMFICMCFDGKWG